jgi:hypothetical protein
MAAVVLVHHITGVLALPEEADQKVSQERVVDPFGILKSQRAYIDQIN